MSWCDEHCLLPGAVLARVCCYIRLGALSHGIEVGHHVARMQVPDGVGIKCSFTPHNTRHVKGMRLCEGDG